MLDLGTLRIGIKADTSAAKSELKQVENQTKDVEQTTEKSTKSMGDSWKNFSTKVKTAAAIGIAAVTAAVSGLVNAANETQEDMGKLSVAFEQAGYSAETANGVFTDFVGLMGETDTAVEASNHLARLCSSEEELAQWTNIAAGVFATFGDSLPLEGLTEAANETAKVGTVTGSLADALNWAGVNEDEFNQKLAACSTEQERAQLITDTLNGLYAEAGEQYRQNNEALIEYRENQAELNNKLGELGMLVLPAISGLMGLATGFLDLATYLLTTNDSLDTIIEKLNGGLQEAFNTLPGMFTQVWNQITVGFQTAMQLIPALLPTFIQGIISTFVTMIPVVLQSAITMFMSLVDALIQIIPILLATVPQVISAVVNLLPTLIPMLLQAAMNLFMALVNAIPEILPQLIQAAIDAINAVVTMLPTLIPIVLNAAVMLFTSLVQSIPQILPQLLSAVASAIGSVVSYLPSFIGSVLGAAKTLFMGIVQAIPQIVGSLLSAIGNLISQGVNAVRNKVGEFLSAGRNLMEGLIDGVIGGASGLVDSVLNAVGGAVNAVKNFLGIASPSKLFKEFGLFTMEGMEQGIDKGVSGAVEAALGAAKQVAGAFNVNLPDVEANYNAYAASRVGTSTSAANPYGGARTNIIVNNYSPKTLNEKDSAREFKRSVRQLALA